jgi:phosphonoacetaldehyde hydrolase
MTTNPNPVRALLLDWAGTTIDYGSLAPAGVFQEIFRACGVEVTQAEARGPMGMAKRDHIAEVLKLPRVAAARPPTTPTSIGFTGNSYRCRSGSWRSMRC